MSSNSQFNMSDESLISSLAFGDTKAIQYIYKSFYPTIEKMVFKMNGSVDDAYDIFQDSVTIVYEKAKADDLHLSCQLSTYIVSVAKNLWLKKLSKNKRQSVSVLYDDMEESVAVDSDITHFHEFENNVTKLQDCFIKIGEPCNTLLKAFYVENKSMQEIAINFGYTNTDNAKTQKYKCLNRLRKLFFNKNENEFLNERTY